MVRAVVCRKHSGLGRFSIEDFDGTVLYRAESIDGARAISKRNLAAGKVAWVLIREAVETCAAGKED